MKRRFKIICNKFYLFNYYLDNNPIFSIIFLILSILIPNLFIAFASSGKLLLIGAFMYLLIGIFSICRYLINKGELKVDFSLYDIPHQNDIIVFGDLVSPELEQNIPFTKIGWYRNQEFKINNIIYTRRDVILHIVDTSNNLINISYFPTRKYWKTKSELRDKKLNNILQNS